MAYYYLQFAQAYGEGAYGESTYSCTSGDDCETTTSTGTTTGTGGTTGSGGALADTGIEVLAFATIACIIIFVALIVRFVRRPNIQQKPVLQEVEIPDDQQPRGPRAS